MMYWMYYQKYAQFPRDNFFSYFGYDPFTVHTMLFPLSLHFYDEYKKPEVAFENAGLLFAPQSEFGSWRRERGLFFCRFEISRRFTFEAQVA